MSRTLQKSDRSGQGQVGATAEKVQTNSSPVLSRLRTATREIHLRLEDKLDVVNELADPAQRPGTIKRYAELHVPADEALGPHLEEVADLEFSSRSRAAVLARHLQGDTPPGFPIPRCRAEALGMLYVLEGATLGGRLILRTLASRGIEDPALAFLDPYGSASGARWRDFLAVLSRELGADGGLIEAACNGAVRGFLHAETVLCGAQR